MAIDTGRNSGLSVDALSDEELVQRCRVDLPHVTTAFNQIVERYQQYVFSLAKSKLGNREDAEDAAQEAFIRVYFGIEKFRGDSSLKTWITTIVMNVCMTMLLTQKRRGWRVFVPSDDVDLGTLYASLVTNQSEQRFWSWIGGVLRKMTTPYRKVFIFRYFKNYNMTDIARRVSSNTGAIRKRLQRAKDQFMNIFFEED